MAYARKRAGADGSHRLETPVGRCFEPLFEDRKDAGRRLARFLTGRIPEDALLLGLPRGGVIVAAAAGSVLELAVDVYVVRKLRAPLHPELAFGAVAEDGPPVLDEQTIDDVHISSEYIAAEIAGRRLEIERYQRIYRDGRPLDDVSGRSLVVVDDGIATGATVESAVRGLRTRGPRELIVAAPVASPLAVDRLQPWSDAVHVLSAPENFFAVGQYFRRFTETADDEVVKALSA